MGLRPEQPYVGSEAFPSYRTPWERQFMPPANMEWHACPVAVGNLAESERELPPLRVIRREVRVISGQPSVASVVLEFDGRRREATCTAPGPVLALLKCLNECLGLRLELKDYRARAVHPGKLKALIGWSAGFSTAGISDDLIDASWRAMVEACQVVLARAPVPSGYGWGV
jgi:hypothetical protein